MKMTKQQWRILAAAVHQLDMQEGTIAAIKKLRSETDCGLLEAKRAVEALRKVKWNNV